MDGKAHNNTLPKKERLHGKKDIDRLLVKGKYGASGILRYRYHPNELEYSRLIISVPKKLFKKAVKRNLLKRRIRETWRHLKPNITSEHYDILLMYSSKEVADYQEIKSLIDHIISRLNETLGK